MKRRPTRRPRKLRKPGSAPRMECLEARHLLAGNLQITNVQYLDGEFNPIDSPTVGEEIRLRAEWTSTDIDRSYRIRFLHDNIPLTTALLSTPSAKPGEVVHSATALGGWFASPGQHRIEVRLDSADQIVENNESDNRFVINYTPNAPTTLPDKFKSPLGGRQNEDWFVTNYVDIDPRSQIRDFTGGTYSQARSRGVDIALPNAASIDEGVPIHAMADGIIQNVNGVAQQGFVINGMELDERSGSLAKQIGDFNGDGFVDFAVTAAGTERTYVVFGHSETLFSSFELSSLLSENGGDGTKGLVLEEAQVTSLDYGDFNADGISDLALGVPTASVGDTLDVGRVYVVYGSADPHPAQFDLSQLLPENGGDGTSGFVLTGKNGGDAAGSSIANLGDINGDFIDDLVIGAPNSEIGMPDVETTEIIETEIFDIGKAYVVFGKLAPFAAEIELKSLESAFQGDGSQGVVFYGVNEFDRLGQTVAGLGDINNDGLADIGLGAAFFGSIGEAYVVFGKRAGWEPEFNLVQLCPPPPPPPPPDADDPPPPPPIDPPPPPPVNQGDGSQGFVVPGLNFFDETAAALGKAGDLNQDGIDDWFLSATGADGTGFNRGLVYLLYGQSQPYEPVFDLALVSRAANGELGSVIEGAANFDRIGSSVANLGDINGDSLSDLIIGAPAAGSLTEGEAYVLFGRAGGLGASYWLDNLFNGVGTDGFVIRGESFGSETGISVASVGDINRDGLGDIIVGAPAIDSSETASGRSYVLFGRSSNYGPVVELSSLYVPPNQVEIDHGDGWKTRLSRLLPYSSTVKVGDFVSAGDLVGLVGPNTERTQPIFHFEVSHHGSIVDPFQDASAYFVDPLAYQGGTERSVLKFGVTNVEPTEDINEEPPAAYRLHPTFVRSIYFWYDISHLNARDSYDVIWYRPDGSIDPDSVSYTSGQRRGIRQFETLTKNWSELPGEWQVALVINDVERARSTFQITSQPLVPQIRVETAESIVLNGRSQAYDFGNNALGATPPVQTFRIENVGSGVLRLNLGQLPVGFTMLGAFPNAINPSEHAEVSIRLDTAKSGPKFGEWRFTSDDPDEPFFHIPLQGNVRGSLPFGSPQVILPDAAVAYFYRSQPVLLDPLAVFVDADSAVLPGTIVTVDQLAGGEAADRINLRASNSNGIEIKLDDDIVLVNDLEVGSVSGGTNGESFRLVLNGNATPEILQLLLRNLEFSNSNAIPGTQLRTLGISAVDSAGLTSHLALKRVVVAPSIVNQLPTIDALSVNPSLVVQPDLVEISASGARDDDGTIKRIDFFVESNGVQGLQTGAGGDRLVGNDSNGSDGYVVSLASAQLAIGLHVIYGQAIDDADGRGFPVQTSLEVVQANSAPIIVFVDANPKQVQLGEPTVLTAGGVSDVDDPIANVSFYSESNGQTGLQVGTGGDRLLGIDSDFSSGWKLDYATTGLTDGRYLIYAQATDARSARSNVVSTELTVGNPVPLNSIFPLSNLLAENGGNGSAGIVVNGAIPNSQTGTTALSIGDVNGDGFDDLLVAAPSLGVGNPILPGAGQAYVVFGKSEFAQAEAELSQLNGTNGFTLRGVQSQGQLGSAAAGIGDMNGDGIQDFAVSAAAFDGSTQNSGVVYVVFGRVSGFSSSLDVNSLNGINGFAIQGPAADAQLGVTLSGAGDVNGDGFTDLIAGTNVVGQGVRAYVVYGRSGIFPPSISTANLNAATGLRIVGRDGAANNPGVGLPTSVSGGGDVNGDGFSDLLVGGAAPTGTEHFVVLGRSGLPASMDVGTLTGVNGFSVIGIASSVPEGSWVGDMNADGFDDFVIGADQARSQAGDAYVFFGRSGNFPPNTSTEVLDGIIGFQIQGKVANDRAAASVSAAGDFNGDGFADLLIGASQANPGSPSRSLAGEAYVVYGRSAGDYPAIFQLADIDGANGVRLTGVASGDQAGSTVGGGFDVNGDGFDDQLIASPAGDPGSPARNEAGRTFVVLGANFTQSVSQIGDRNPNVLTGSFFAESIIAGQGNDLLNGLGNNDVLRAAQGDDQISISDANFRFISGGPGFDSLIVNTRDVHLDLRSLSDNRIQGIERIDISGVGNNRLTLSARDVLNLSNTSNTLEIMRNDGDQVDIGSGWRLLDVAIINGRTVNTITQGAATVKLQAVTEGAPWQHPTNPLDVNNSGNVTNEDALIVINFLNRSPRAKDPLPNPYLPNFAPKPAGNEDYYDVDGDGFVTPLDALLIINFLNHGGETEGEGEVSNESIHDRAITELAVENNPLRPSASSHSDLHWGDLQWSDLEFAEVLSALSSMHRHRRARG